MPELDGFDVLEELQKHDDWRDIPVVILTAEPLSAEDRKRLHGYFEGILEKGSCSRTQLLEIVGRSIKRPAQGIAAERAT